VLAFDDEGIARLTRAIRDVSPRKRRRWLADIARKLDPPDPKALAAKLDPPSTNKKDTKSSRLDLVKVNEKRRAAVRRAVALHKKRSRAGIAITRVPYDGVALANLELAGWLPPYREGYSEAEISAAIAALIKTRNLPLSH
jgi:hypothetical protein